MASENSHPLQPGDVATLLQATADEVRVELSALPAEIAGWHPGPAEWCVKETHGYVLVLPCNRGRRPNLSRWPFLTVAKCHPAPMPTPLAWKGQATNAPASSRDYRDS